MDGRLLPSYDLKMFQCLSDAHSQTFGYVDRE